MNTKKLAVLIITALWSVFSLPSITWAEVDDDFDGGEVQSYDSIVKDLTKSAAPVKSRAKLPHQESPSSLEESAIHAGIAYANMLESIDAPKGKIFAAQAGIQVSLGIDLFSEHLSSEGTLITFGDQDYNGTSVSVKEFDLMFYGKGLLIPKLKGKVGAGIGGRYLTLTTGPNAIQYSTPSSVFSVGADYYFVEAFSLGGEISMRNAMVGETLDQRSYTMLVRLDTHF